MGRRRKLKEREEEEEDNHHIVLTDSSPHSYSPSHSPIILNPNPADYWSPVSTEKHANADADADADANMVSSRRASLRSATKRTIQACQAPPCAQESPSRHQSEDEYIQNGYKVKQESMPILRKILAKYGDIAKDCTLTGKTSRSMYLGMIIDIIQELQDKDLGRIEQDYLQDMIGLVKEFKNIRLEVGWLLQRLQDVLEASRIMTECCVLKEKRESIRRAIEAREEELEECETEKMALEARIRAICEQEAACKEAFARDLNEISMITETISSFKPKVGRFHHSLASDLL
ncbi:hypothetical protein HN51_037959 [Arachis hypogaea]|uniref:Uncharacterized protein n=1 Tax=Arachis hypogaea TaxID=3818 RepID=A0A444ZU01_ARAHY|nr:uncharacterized protein LOC112792150 [Arachis hypogaea]QHO03595.1 uncharacterized protein DS421_13g433500 [Arachis hypogaea]RYR17626.1 hypothetical protein Ahy_B03g062325 [Arachis hypogaea]